MALTERHVEGSPELTEQAIHAAIARQVREQRRQLGLTVAQLSERSGISKGMLSKIENAQASPSLATLARLAAAVGVPVTSFFRGLEEEHDALHVRSGEGLDIVRRGTRVGHRYQLLGSMRGAGQADRAGSRHLDGGLRGLPAVPARRHRVHLHAEREDDVRLRRGPLRDAPGDALEFEGDVPHGPVELTKLPITFLSVIATGALPADGS